MAKVKNNALVKGFSGTIGGELTFRQIGGETFVSKYQKAPTVLATEKKAAVQTKFGLATAYARKAVKDPAIKSLYQAFVKGGQRAFNIAMIDALNPPVVQSIAAENYSGLVGDSILIRAIDDFKVASVVVSIYNQKGDLVEKGNAVALENGENDWQYIATKSNKEFHGSVIDAVAIDLPGNSASLNIHVS